MKKVFFLFLMALCSIGVSAKKKVVYVEYFSYSSEIGDVRTEQVRNSVISALAFYQHLQVVDVASQSSLAKEKDRRSDEDALEDETARIGKMKKLGANYLVQGYVSTLDITPKVERNKKGEEKITYNAVMSYSIKVVDCENGTLMSTDMFTYDCKNCKNEEECVQKMLKKTTKSINEVVTKDFKLNSIVLDSDYESKKDISKKDILVKCFINIGEDDGVVPGTVFAVNKAIIKVGRVSWVEVGEIVVENVVAGDLSLCKVKKGAAEIQTALEEIISIKETDPNNAHDLIVESKSFPTKILSKGLF